MEAHWSLQAPSQPRRCPLQAAQLEKCWCLPPRRLKPTRTTIGRPIETALPRHGRTSAARSAPCAEDRVVESGPWLVRMDAARRAVLQRRPSNPSVRPRAQLSSLAHTRLRRLAGAPCQERLPPVPETFSERGLRSACALLSSLAIDWPCLPEPRTSSRPKSRTARVMTLPV